MELTTQQINEFAENRFGRGSSIDSKLDDNTILVKTPSGNLMKVKSSDVNNWNLGASQRQKQQQNDEITQEARANVQRERKQHRQHKADQKEQLAAGVQAKRDRRDSEHKSFTDYQV